MKSRERLSGRKNEMQTKAILMFSQKNIIINMTSASTKQESMGGFLQGV